jgi:hypothetical protein
MRAIRELPVAAPLLLVALAALFGGGPGDGSIMWLGGGALLCLLGLLWSRGMPGGLASVLPLYALAAWCAISIAWSWLPDRSWDYANRTLVYALFATLGLWLAPRARLVALGLAAVIAVVVAWSLLGKILPPVYDYGGVGVTARLRGPVGLWNQLALLADFGLVLALWLRGRLGVLLAYACGVALLLTYSRGGLVAAAVAVSAWLALSDERVEGAATLVAAGIPAGVVVGIAFALPGITSDGQSLSTRWRDGLVFGAVLLAGGVATSVLAPRVPRPADTPALRRAALVALVVAVAAGLAVLVSHGLASGTVGNTSGRFASTSSNFRFTWWRQAWRGFEHHVLGGTGAGSFNLLNLRYRSTYLDFTTEPHDLPLQFLAETGLVGLVLLVLAAGALTRGTLRRSGPGLALGLLLPAYLVHALVDIDWDFVAVSAPAFLAAGCLAGRVSERRVSGFAVVAASGCALLVFGALLLPWLGRRWASEALDAATGTHPARAFTPARRALAADPLLVDPYWDEATAADALGRPRAAFSYYVAAVRGQPESPTTWLLAGEYALNTLNCPYAAYHYLERYTELNKQARPSEGGDDYLRALRRVNSAQGTC